MYLLYTDESGKSGLKDLRQPFHVLGGLIVQDKQWQAMEVDLNERIDALVPPPRSHLWELHMTDMVNGKGHFKRMSRTTREALCDAVLDVLGAHRPTIMMMAIDKEKHSKKYYSPDPPEEMTYRFMIERFDIFLGRLPENEVGVIVSDEQKGEEDTIRKAHSKFRKEGTPHSINCVVETPFFVPSHWSRMIQIIDVCTWLCAKMLRAKKAGEPIPTQWNRVEPHLDGHPYPNGYGLKVFP